MEILIVTDSPAEGKTLSTTIAAHGHSATWRVGVAEARRHIERKLWELDAIIHSSDSMGLSQAIGFAQFLVLLRDRRGYHNRPYFVVLAREIPSEFARQIQAAGGFAMPHQAGIAKLLNFLEVFDSQIKSDFYRPYLLLEHGYTDEQNLYCDDEETILGICAGYLGPPVPSFQSNRTAVLIDYLCRQRYAKTDEEICDGISESPFYQAQLNGAHLAPRAIKMLVCRARERLQSALVACHAPVTGKQVVANVPGHTRKYKVEGVFVKIVHKNRRM